MTKAELITAVAERQGLSRAQAKDVIEDVFLTIAATVESGNVVNVGGFGNFKPVTRAARVSRNPRTGETINVPAKNAIKFKPAKAIKDALN
mgnify:CR=1 FL=1